MENSNKIRKIVQSVLKETRFDTSPPHLKVSTSTKLLNAAKRDGYLESGYGGWVMDAAIEIADKWDRLNDEDKKIYRDAYYNAFLQKIKSVSPRSVPSRHINESVKLTATHGRSGTGTLSWYAEEYLLNLGSIVLTNLDGAVQNELKMKLAMSKSSTKMVSNSLVTKLIVDGVTENGKKVDSEFVLTFNVNFEQNGNTAGTVTYKGTTDTFNLNSKHSESDMTLFISEIVNHVLNTIKIESKGQ